MQNIQHQIQLVIRRKGMSPALYCHKYVRVHIIKADKNFADCCARHPRQPEALAGESFLSGAATDVNNTLQ